MVSAVVPVPPAVVPVAPAVVPVACSVGPAVVGGTGTSLAMQLAAAVGMARGFVASGAEEEKIDSAQVAGDRISRPRHSVERRIGVQRLPVLGEIAIRVVHSVAAAVPTSKRRAAGHVASPGHVRWALRHARYPLGTGPPQCPPALPP